MAGSLVGARNTGILAALDNALHHDAMQRWVARDLVSQAARAVLGAKRLSL